LISVFLSILERGYNRIDEDNNCWMSEKGIRIDNNPNLTVRLQKLLLSYLKNREPRARFDGFLGDCSIGC